jgi:ABC-type arginine/histidine transport system permease subunit
MMQNLGIGRWLSIAIAVMVVIAVWKANNGDVSNIVLSIWTLINTGANILLDLWNKFIGSGSFQSALNSTLSSGSVAP